MSTKSSRIESEERMKDFQILQTAEIPVNFTQLKWKRNPYMLKSNTSCTMEPKKAFKSLLKRKVTPAEMIWISESIAANCLLTLKMSSSLTNGWSSLLVGWVSVSLASIWLTHSCRFWSESTLSAQRRTMRRSSRASFRQRLRSS